MRTESWAGAGGASFDKDVLALAGSIGINFGIDKNLAQVGKSPQKYCIMRLKKQCNLLLLPFRCCYSRIQREMRCTEQERAFQVLWSLNCGTVTWSRASVARPNRPDWRRSRRLLSCAATFYHASPFPMNNRLFGLDNPRLDPSLALGSS